MGRTKNTVDDKERPAFCQLRPISEGLVYLLSIVLGSDSANKVRLVVRFDFTDNRLDWLFEERRKDRDHQDLKDLAAPFCDRTAKLRRIAVAVNHAGGSGGSGGNGEGRIGCRAKRGRVIRTFLEAVGQVLAQAAGLVLVKDNLHGAFL